MVLRLGTWRWWCSAAVALNGVESKGGSIGSIGAGHGQFIRPQGIAFDRSGHLVVADFGNHRVQVLRYRDGAHVRSIGSEGSGAGQLQRPYGVAIDGDGRIIVSDSGNHRVQVLP